MNVMDSKLVHKEIANALAAVTLATRSYTILDRLGNAISLDAVDKAVYELTRSLSVMHGNPKEGQSIEVKGDEILVKGEWQKKQREFRIEGPLPTSEDYRQFLEEAAKDIKIARHTAAYAAGVVASKLSESAKQEAG
jgi:CRISPR type I-A-associated protein Csa5